MHPKLAWNPAVTPLRVAAPILYAVAGFAWIIGGDLLVAFLPDTGDASAAWFTSSRALIFITFSAVALYALLRRVDVVDGERTAKPSVTVMLIIVAAVLVTGGSYALFRFQSAEELKSWRSELRAEAEAHALRVETWFESRAKEITLVADSQLLSNEIRSWQGTPSEEHAAEILERLSLLHKVNAAEMLAVEAVSADGRTLFAAGDIGATRVEPELVARVLRTQRHAFGVPRVDEEGKGRALLAVAAPISGTEQTAAQTALVAVFDMRAMFLTTEAHRDGARHATMRHQLAYVRDGQVTLLEAEEKGWEVVATSAAQATEARLADRIQGSGDQVIERIQDRHGALVLAAVRHVPGSDWYVLVKVDWQHVNEVTSRLSRIGLAVLALMAMIAAGGIGWIRHRAKHASEKSLVEAEKRISALTEHFELANRFANDAIMLVGPTGRIVQVNDRCIEMYGYSRSELIGMKTCALRPPGDDSEGPTVRRFGDTGNFALIFETIHCRKDGSTFPVEVSARRFKVGERIYSQSIVRDITKRRKNEQALARIAEERDAMAERLRKQFHAMPYPCALTDADLNVVEVNTAFERLFGWAASELLGSDALEKVVPPEHLEKVRKVVRSTRDQKSPVENINPNVTRDGRELMCHWTNIPLLGPDGEFTGQFAMCKDLTEAKALARKVAEGEATFRALAESAPVGVFQVGADRSLTYLNPAIINMFGLDTMDAQEIWRGGYLLPEERERAANLRRHVFAGEDTSPEEFRYTRKDGGTGWLLVRAVAIRGDDGTVQKVVGTATDVTELKKQEMHLERLVVDRTEEYRAAKEAAERANAVKTEFLASVSHDLRTPLNSIVGFTEVLLEKSGGPLTEKQERQLGVIRDAARRLRGLISDLLDISRIETGRLTLKAEPVAVGELVTRVVEGFAAEARNKGLALAVEADNGMGTVTTDAERVEQILGNLVANAIKYTTSGAVAVRAGIIDDEVVVSVTDTGIGIPHDNLQRIFDPFVQLPGEPGKPRRGIGLGLAISRKLASALGGSVDVESTIGLGSTFRLRLPAAAPSA